MRWIVILLVLVGGCIWAGCVTIDKEAAGLLLDTAERVSASGNVTFDNPTLTTSWVTKMGVEVKLEGVRASGKVDAERGGTTEPSP